MEAAAGEQQQAGAAGGGVTRRTPTPTQHHPLAAEMEGLQGAQPQQSLNGDAAAAAPAAAPPDSDGVDACAACGFGITGDEQAVCALRGVYHPECFRCHTCGAALLPLPPASTPSLANAAARELRRVRLGSLDGDGAGGREEGEEAEEPDNDDEEEGGEDGHLTFLQLGGLPLCRQHFLALQEAEQEQEEEEEEGEEEGGGAATTAAVTETITSPPPSAFATPDRHHHPSPPSSPALSYATASAPASPTVRFAPASDAGAESGNGGGSGRLPSIFHSADGIERLRIPPPGDDEHDEAPGSEPSPASLSRLRRSKSATALRRGRPAAQQGRPHEHHSHRRRGSHAQPLLSVAARETAAERDARLLRRKASQEQLLFGGPAAAAVSSPPLSPPLEKEPREKQRPPLTTASALAFGVRVAAETRGQSPARRRRAAAAGAAAAQDGDEEEEEQEKEEKEEELGKEAFTARRQLELMYSHPNDETAPSSSSSSSFFWEEAAPAVFARIRRLFGVASDAYASALAALEEEGREGGTGKSGSLFFKPPRGDTGASALVVVKSVSDEEERFLLAELEAYFQVMLHRGAQSLLPRFLGLYRVKLPGKPPTKLLAQRNVFALPIPQLRLRERFDLKGSLIRRLAVSDPPTAAESNGGTPPAPPQTSSSSSSSSSKGGSSGNCCGKGGRVQKDLAFCRAHDGTDDAGHGIKAAPGAECRVLRLGEGPKKRLLSYLAADVEWLRRRHVVDYSLLLGCASTQELNTNPWAKRSGGGSSLAALLPGAADEEARHRLYSLWLPAPPEPEAAGPLAASPPSSSSSSSSIYHSQEAYVLGIVDVLQTFTLKRRLETFVKTGITSLEGNDPEGLSVVDPGSYAQRFISFFDKHTA